MVTAEQVTAIVEYTQKALPPISEWTVPDGYPTSLGMCVSDTPAMLAQTIRDCGGSESFAAEVKSRHRTSTRNGILKAEAVQRAATVLADAGIETSQDLGRANDDIRVSWLGIPGQRSGVSWRYFQMLAGVAAQSAIPRRWTSSVAHNNGCQLHVRR
jgi:hypothetical protein